MDEAGGGGPCTAAVHSVRTPMGCEGVQVVVSRGERKEEEKDDQLTNYDDLQAGGASTNSLQPGGASTNSLQPGG